MQQTIIGVAAGRLAAMAEMEATRDALRARVAELEAERDKAVAELRLTHQLAEDREQQAEEYRCLYDNARAWARLWKRAAIIERALPVRESTWCNRRWWCERFLDHTARTTRRVRDNLRRGLGLPSASATNAAASEGGA